MGRFGLLWFQCCEHGARGRGKKGLCLFQSDSWQELLAGATCVMAAIIVWPQLAFGARSNGLSRHMRWTVGQERVFSHGERERESGAALGHGRQMGAAGTGRCG